VKTWFQAFAFKWVNLYRYAMVEMATRLGLNVEGVMLGGAVQLTHSLKATGFNLERIE
jgi:hypothetical protein